MKKRLKKDKQLLSFIKLVSEEYTLERAILFGSRARGTELDCSDYDILLVSPQFEGIDFVDRIRIVTRYWQAPVGVEVLCYTPEEFERKEKQICIVREAVREGINLL